MSSGPGIYGMNRTERLGNLIGIRTGYFSRGRIEEAANGKYRIIQLRDFDNTRTVLDKDALTRFDPGDMRSDQTIKPQEVLFLAKGVHNFAYHPGPLPDPTLAASYFYVLTPSAEISPQYLCWFLNHSHTRRIFDRIAGVGARMPVVKKSDLADITIPLPPTHAQNRIVQLHSITLQEAALLDDLKQKRRTFIDAVTMTIAEQNENEDTR